jgi:small multidrug resistance pump
VLLAQWPVAQQQKNIERHPVHYIFLFVAVVFETLGTTALQASQQFTKVWPTLGAIVAYAGAFYFLGITLKFMPVGIVYALWSGLGIVFITVIGFTVFGQRLDAAAIAGLALIIAGIVVIQVFSNATTH